MVHGRARGDGVKRRRRRGRQRGRSAAQAIRDGYRVVLDERRWIDFAGLGFEREPPRDPAKDALTQRQRLAYRQAGMFVGWLRMRDETAFLQLLRALEAGRPFGPSFEVGLRRKRAVALARFRFRFHLSERAEAQARLTRATAHFKNT